MNASVSILKNTLEPAPISPVEDIVAELRAGRMVILVDEEDRENEGDIVIAADHVTPEAINFMARHARGLVCLTLTRSICERLHLPPMAARNGTRYATAFTVSIEAAQGVTTGISAADRAHTVRTAIAPNAKPSDLVQPGHVFPIQAVDGGVLMRAGHTEAGCDLAAMAGCAPAAVICEVMNEDGTMARLPDLRLFATQHNIKIGTIAALIEHRSQTETLIEEVGRRPMPTRWGTFETIAFRDKPSGGLHLALIQGAWQPGDTVPVRVHEPLSVLDALELNRPGHAWALDASLAYIARTGYGVAVLLNCGESSTRLLEKFNTAPTASASASATASQAPGAPAPIDLRSHGIGAQILRACGVHKMTILGTPRRMPNLAAGFSLEIAGYVPQEQD